MDDALKNINILLETFHLYNDTPVKINEIRMLCSSVLSKLNKLNCILINESCELPLHIEEVINHFNEIVPAIQSYISIGAKTFTTIRKRNIFINRDKIRKKQHSSFTTKLDEIQKILSGACKYIHLNKGNNNNNNNNNNIKNKNALEFWNISFGKSIQFVSYNKFFEAYEEKYDEINDNTKKLIINQFNNSNNDIIDYNMLNDMINILDWPFNINNNNNNNNNENIIIQKKKKLKKRKSSKGSLMKIKNNDDSNILSKKTKKKRINRRLNRSETLPNLSSFKGKGKRSKSLGRNLISMKSLLSSNNNNNNNNKNNNKNRSNSNSLRPRTALRRNSTITDLSNSQRNYDEIDNIVRDLYEVNLGNIKRYVKANAGGSRGGFGGNEKRNTLGINNINRSGLDKYIYRGRETALHVACRIGNIDVIRILLDGGANPHVYSKKKLLPIHEAIRFGHINVFNILKDVTESKKLRSIPLICYAAKEGSLASIKYLTNNTNINIINLKNKNGERPVYLSFLMGHTNCLDYIFNELDNKVKLKVRTRDGWSILDAAVACDAVKYMNRIMDIEIDSINNNDNSNSMTENSVASNSDDEDNSISVSEVSMSIEAQIHSKDMTGSNALHRVRSPEMVQHLLNMNADINSVDNASETPLHSAVRSGFFDVITFMLKHSNIDPNVNDMYGHTPLHLAVEDNDMMSVQHLINHPQIDINITDERGQTPLHTAVHDVDLQMVQILLKCKGVNPNIGNNRGKTPLGQLCARGGRESLSNEQMKIVELLLSYKADLSLKDNHDLTPLAHAYIYNNMKLARLLIESSHNFDVNEQITQGKTALSLTCDNIDESKRNEVHEFVKFLLKNKADPNIKDNQDMTSLSIAYENDDDDLLDLLLTNGADPNIKIYNTPLFHKALQTRDNVTIYNMIKAQVDLNCEDVPNRCSTPLHRCIKAAQSYNKELRNLMIDRIKMLLACGAKQDIRDRKLRVPLVACYEYGDFEIANILLDFLLPGRSDVRRNKSGAISARSSALPIKHLKNSSPQLVLKRLSNKSNNDDDYQVPIKLNEDNKPIVDWYFSNKWYQDRRVLDMADMKGNTILHYVAGQKQNTQEIWNVLECSPSLNVVNKKGETPLLLASKYGTTENVKALLQSNLDVNIASNNGETSLMAASANGAQNIVSALLIGRAHVNHVRDDAYTALALAVENGNLLTVEALIESGADTNIMVTKNKLSLAHLAAVQDDSRVLTYLANHNVPINTLTTKGTSPLMFAVERDYLLHVKTLINSNADVNLHDKDGLSPLLIALYRQNSEIAIEILKAGGSITHSNNNGSFCFNTIQMLAYFEVYNSRHIHPVVAEVINSPELSMVTGLTRVVYYNRKYLLNHLLRGGYSLMNELEASLNIAKKYGFGDIVNILAKKLNVEAPDLQKIRPKYTEQSPLLPLE